MDRTKLKIYAPQARREFIEAMTERAAFYGLTADKTEPIVEKGDVLVIGGRSFPIAVARKRKSLEDRIKLHGFQQTMEAMAYTWFNRLVAIRYMELHGYLDHGYRVLSHSDGKQTPEILEHAEHVEFPGLNQDRVIDLKLAGNKEGELYRLLLTAQCNALHSAMPFLFERIDDETELLLPDNLLNSDSLIRKLVGEIEEADWKEVEIIGWLYQFYISEKKGEVINRRGVISKDEIPAATQFFTPHWIVRYLVENSLGRLWMLNHPESRLIKQMEYYIPPEEPETDILRIVSPEEIKICDPACGSGHMLIYAFDLLYSIYEEQGYQPNDIPRLILAHNLYGIEIDQRAGALAAFALTMKARQKDRRFFTRKPKSDDSLPTRSDHVVTQPNICVLQNIQVDPEDLSTYMDTVGRDLFSGGLKGVVNQWEEADNFGSLICPLVTDVSEVLELLHERQMGEPPFLAGIHSKVLTALRQADYLSPKYHVVIGNPPYLDKKEINRQIEAFIKIAHPKSQQDICGAHIDRGLALVVEKGYLAYATVPNWMFLASSRQLRSMILRVVSVNTLAIMGSRSRYACSSAFVFKKLRTQMLGTYFILNDALQSIETNFLFLKRLASRDYFIVDQPRFRNLPQLTVAPLVGKSTRRIFEEGEPLKNLLDIERGTSASNPGVSVRHWHELSFQTIGFGYASINQIDMASIRWLPYMWRIGFRKWYGDRVYVVLAEEVVGWSKWQSDWRNKGKMASFKPMISWSFADKGLSARYLEQGFVCGSGEYTRCNESDREQLVYAGLLSSKLGLHFVMSVDATRNVNFNRVSTIPVTPSVKAIFPEVSILVEKAVEISKSDWDSYEFSWGFSTSPLLVDNRSVSLAQVFRDVRAKWNLIVAEMQSIEMKLNNLFIEAYVVEEEVDGIVPIEEITLDLNPYYRYGSDKSESELEVLLLADTMREFISYAVGCMTGRYSLDKPGLILARQGETIQDYLRIVGSERWSMRSEGDRGVRSTADCHPLTFEPNEDNVIPMLDGDWFTDDINERFKEFLRVTFGTEHYEENLTFLENALYPDNLTGKERRTIREYFLNEFHNHHNKLYKKCPVYWLFSSGKHGAFRALIYMHRYNSSTLSRMLTEYVVPLQFKFNARIEKVESEIPTAGSKSLRKKLESELKKLIKQRGELEEFDEKLRHYADQQIELDLDDGVKVNYAKFGDLLAESKAMIGGKDDE